MSSNKTSQLITVGLLASVLLGFYRGFFEAPVDVNQGEVYRIMFLHVPCALSAFLAAFVLFLFALLALVKKDEQQLRWQRASAEISLVLTIITLATGSIWGRPTWGTWWVWDARLTTTLLLALVLAGYLLMYTSTAAGPARIRSCSILGIVIFADIPIIYKSVDWWRTLHQGHSLERGKSPMSPEIRSVLLYCMAMVAIYTVWLIYLRVRTIKLQDEVTDLSYEKLR